MELNFISKLPKELNSLIKNYLRYNQLRTVCRISNEFKNAKKHTMTISAHVIHIFIERFNKRYRQRYFSFQFIEPDEYCRLFIFSYFKFSKIWNLPNINYPSWYNGYQRQSAGTHLEVC